MANLRSTRSAAAGAQHLAFATVYLCVALIDAGDYQAAFSIQGATNDASTSAISKGASATEHLVDLTRGRHQNLVFGVADGDEEFAGEQPGDIRTRVAASFRVRRNLAGVRAARAQPDDGLNSDFDPGTRHDRRLSPRDYLVSPGAALCGSNLYPGASYRSVLSRATELRFAACRTRVVRAFGDTCCRSPHSQAVLPGTKGHFAVAWDEVLAVGFQLSPGEKDRPC